MSIFFSKTFSVNNIDSILKKYKVGLEKKNNIIKYVK